jgi:hypothetical protein
MHAYGVAASPDEPFVVPPSVEVLDDLRSCHRPEREHVDFQLVNREVVAAVNPEDPAAPQESSSLATVQPRKRRTSQLFAASICAGVARECMPAQ